MAHSVLPSSLYILITLAFCLLFSPFIARILRLPIAAVEIILGSFAGLFIEGKDNEYFKLVADIGFYYLMFIAGMEINLKSFFKSRGSLLRQAFFYIIFLYLTSFILVELLDLPLIFIIIIPVMSVGLLGILYKDFGKDSKWLNSSMIVATLAEIVSIISLSIAATALKESASLELIFSLVYLLGFLLLSLFLYKGLKTLFWWYPELKTIIMPKQDKNEKDLRFCIGVFILIVVLMLGLKLEVALGAFIAGSFITTFFDHKDDLEYKLGSFGYGFLIPIFFIFVGFSFKLSNLFDKEILIGALALSACMIILRLFGSLFFLKELAKKELLLFALSQSMPLSLLIAVATLSLEVQIIDIKLYSCLVLAAILETILSFSLIKALAKT